MWSPALMIAQDSRQAYRDRQLLPSYLYEACTAGSAMSLVSRSTRATEGMRPSARASSTTYLTFGEDKEQEEVAIRSYSVRIRKGTDMMAPSSENEEPLQERAHPVLQQPIPISDPSSPAPVRRCLRPCPAPSHCLGPARGG